VWPRGVLAGASQGREEHGGRVEGGKIEQQHTVVVMSCLDDWGLRLPDILSWEGGAQTRPPVPLLANVPTKSCHVHINITHSRKGHSHGLTSFVTRPPPYTHI
jgi:hypothetical protein